jgi:acyl-homoserine lactone acylase PvdQ
MNFGPSSLLISGLLVFAAAPATAADEVEILWDEFGVGHVHAPNLEVRFFDCGCAKMKRHGDLILKLWC